MKTLLAIAVLVLAPAVRAADLGGITGFDEFAEEHPGTAQALSRRPSLSQDPDYLKHHPELADYLHDNPLAQSDFQGAALEEEAEDATIIEEEHQEKKDDNFTVHKHSLLSNSSQLPNLPPKDQANGGGDE